jgi:predicted RNA-binding protein with PUA-like domain
MKHWLLKSEPESYSIIDLARDKKTLWTGVRNYQARNYMVDGMKKGDLFLFYHSNAEPAAIVGFGEITKVGQPDPTALDKKSDYFDPKSSKDHPIWFCCEVAFKKMLKPLPLHELKADPALAKMALLQKGSRLSVQPVSEEEFAHILKLAGQVKS